jgi:two-component system, OmpR family, alkaline phosphatase synthesis response regulator PhoP
MSADRRLRIGIVEDEPTIRELVAERLRNEGFDVDEFDSPASLDRARAEWPKIDLFVVDILFHGDRAGLEICSKLRAASPTLPVLILSALSEPLDRIEGLKAGADDYLTKPFEMEELLLRVRGMLKRRSWYAELPQQGSVFAWGSCSIDFVRLEGKKGSETFALTQKEAMLMKCLIQREGQVVGRDEILDKVWGYDVFPSSRTVDNFIVRLRKYFEERPGEPKHIHSVRGMGYKFTR